MARRDDSPGDDIKDMAVNKLANAGTLVRKGKRGKHRGRKRGKARG